MFNKLKATNIFFKHNNKHKYTWETRRREPLADCLIIDYTLKAYIKHSSEIVSYHYLLVNKFE